ncbi:MAG: tRNA (guanine(46)-N(7))-methyltransferase TrmB [Patescibacteria group bacterium]
MGKNKLQHFAELKTFPNVIEPADKKPINWQKLFGNNHPITLELACGKGEYALALARLFPKRNFIGIDIKGARLWRGAKTALAENLTNVAFLRIQIEDLEQYFNCDENSITARCLPPPRRRGLGVVGYDSSPQNTFFTEPTLREPPNIVKEIWLTFPDPFPRQRQMNKRLTSPRFLAMYKNILSPGGAIHLKTDDLNLFNYSIETAIAEGWKIKEVINNIYEMPTLSFRPIRLGRSEPESRNKLDEILNIKTFYENQHLRGGKQIHYVCFSV